VNQRRVVLELVVTKLPIVLQVTNVCNCFVCYLLVDLFLFLFCFCFFFCLKIGTCTSNACVGLSLGTDCTSGGSAACTSAYCDSTTLKCASK
jgi:uncharacterized membrane protein